jgi:hypothetical protein
MILAVPIASRRADFLPRLGELSANFEYGWVNLDTVGTLTRYTAGLEWSPQDWLRFSASVQEVRTPPAVELLADPIVVTPGVRYFDFLTGQTVDVTQTFGGNPLLDPQSVTTSRFAVNAAPLPAINLQLNAEYVATRTSDFISGIPPASAAVLLAFPDRFVRDQSGTLTSVDVRAINFDRQTQDQLRYGFSFIVPIGKAPIGRPKPRTSGADDAAAALGSAEGGEGTLPFSGPRPRLQVVANHTFVLSNEITIRPGLPPVDLLDGGAIGIAGGRPRHQIDLSLAYSARGIGARLSGLWRSESTLEVRQSGSVGRLRFQPLALFNLTAFVEGQRLFPSLGILKSSRLTLSVINLANDRQRVFDPLGRTPLNYQPGYRDALGRTVELSFRKVF